MIIRDLVCPDRHRFEAMLASMTSEDPACACGLQARRMPSRLNIGGKASAGPSREQMPTTWNGIGQGDPTAVKAWHKAMTQRERLEEKYPELAGDRRPILAHEGAFAAAPLRAGDAIPATGTSRAITPTTMKETS